MDDLEFCKLPDEITPPPAENVRMAIHEDIPPAFTAPPQNHSRRRFLRSFLTVSTLVVTVAATTLFAKEDDFPQPDLDPECWKTLEATMEAFHNEDIEQIMKLWDTPEAYEWWTVDLAEYRQELVEGGYIKEDIRIVYQDGCFDHSLRVGKYGLALAVGDRDVAIIYSGGLSRDCDYVDREHSPLYANFEAADYNSDGQLGRASAEFIRYDGETLNNQRPLLTPRSWGTMYTDYHYDVNRLTDSSNMNISQPGYRKVQGSFTRVMYKENGEEYYAYGILSDGTCEYVRSDGIIHRFSLTDGYIDGSNMVYLPDGSYRVTVLDNQGELWTFFSPSIIETISDKLGQAGQYLGNDFLGVMYGPRKID